VPYAEKYRLNVLIVSVNKTHFPCTVHNINFTAKNKCTVGKNKKSWSRKKYMDIFTKVLLVCDLSLEESMGIYTNQKKYIHSEGACLCR
jgi:hypothetical protein